MTTDEQVIEMNFNSSSSASTTTNKNNTETTTNTNTTTNTSTATANNKYVYGILYDKFDDPNEATKFVEDFLRPVAKSAQVTHDKKDNIYLLWVLEEDATKIQTLIQAALDNGKYIYINDGSDVMFRPGMKYNQLNHQRIQLMNYRCYLDKNDVKKFKKLIRPIFLNKKYWITEDGMEFAQIMKDAFERLNNGNGIITSSTKEMQEKEPEYKINTKLIRDWVDKGLIYAQYESLKFKRQDYKYEFEKTKDINHDTKLLDAIKSVEAKILDMRRQYKSKLIEGKRAKRIGD